MNDSPAPSTKASNTPLLRKRTLFHIRASVYRTLGIVGKDIIQFGRVPTAIGLMMALLQFLFLVLEAFNIKIGHTLNIGRLYPFFFIASIYAIGLTITGDEEDSGTWPFLSRLPIPPVRIILNKIIASILLILGWFAVFTPLALLLSTVKFSFLMDRLLLSNTSGLLMDPTGLFYWIALFATGMTASALLRGRIFFAALLGFFVHSAYWILFLLLTNFLFEQGNFRIDLLIQTESYGYSVAAQIIWIFLMFGLLLWDSTTRDESAFPRFFQIPWRLVSLKKTSGVVDPINLANRPLRFGYLLGLLTFLVPFVSYAMTQAKPAIMLDAHGLLVGLHFVSGFFLAIIGSAIGIITCYKQERYPEAFFLYGLPLSINRFTFQRLKKLLVLACILAGAAYVGAMIAAGIDEHTDAAHPPVLWYYILVLYFSMLFGYAGRLLERSMLLAFILTMIISQTWMIVLGAYVIMTMEYSFGVLTLLQQIEFFVWTTLVVIGIPVGLVYLLTAGSTMLEVGDGKRVWLHVLLCLLLVVWGAFFMTLSPLDLLSSLVY